MNDTLTKLNEETKAALITSITSISVANLIAKTKATGDNDSGTFKVIISTADVDRQGESVSQNGWDLSFYKSNPIVLWAHDYGSLPIGVTTSIEVKDGKLVAEGKFAPAAANPFAQQVRMLYDLGMVNTTSVGFIPKEFDTKESGKITKSELLEYSFVPVPANPYALRLDQIKKLGIDTLMLKVKGINIKEEPAATTEAPIDPATPVEPAPAAAPAPEAPKDGEAAKGAVADQVNAIEMREQKWANYMEICEALDAFCTVYFDDNTPVADFSKLLTETIGILQSIAGGQNTEAGEKTVKILNGRKAVTIKQSILAVVRNHLALGSIELSDGNGGADDNGTKKLKVELSGAVKEVNGFIESRELLRTIDKSIEKVLQQFNSAARDR